MVLARRPVSHVLGQRVLTMDFSANWRRYRSTRNTWLCILLVILVGGGTTIFWLDRAASVSPDVALVPFALGIAWLVAYPWGAFVLGYWHCPKCGERFFAKAWWFINIFTRKCVHCGLPKYAD